jgi:hypothetical protein
MDVREVLRLLDEERRVIAYDGMRLESRPGVTRGSLSVGQYRWITWSGLNEGNVDEVIDQEVEHHRRLGVGFEWKVYAHDQPADLRERLERHGFVIGACEAVLVCDLRQGQEWMRQRSGVRVERIDRLEQVDDYRRVYRAVYGEDHDPMADELAASLRIGSQQHRGYVAYADSGEPVSIGRLYTHPKSKFGGLYGGATVTEFRGRGYYKAVVAARARDAAAAGVPYLSVDARPTSQPILQRMGFVRVTDTWPCEWSL